MSIRFLIPADLIHVYLSARKCSINNRGQAVKGTRTGTAPGQQARGRILEIADRKAPNELR